jgi:pimeloyl-ACP methyl ester carboxylesterase
VTARHTVATEGASIAYKTGGTGPLLIMIAGAGGLGDAYRTTADLLRDRYTVVTYDRRCHGASTGDRQKDLDLAQQARDAAAIIADIGAANAYVFGSSGGGCIAVKLAEERPTLVEGLVLHEPAIISVLPDYERRLAHTRRVHDLYQRNGVRFAMLEFGRPVKGVNPVKMALAQRGAVRPDLGFFFAREHVPIASYRPDIQALRQAAIPTAALSGRASRDGYNARTAPALADLIDARFATVNGNHFPFLFDPALFATDLRPHLDWISAHHG